MGERRRQDCFRAYAEEAVFSISKLQPVDGGHAQERPVSYVAFGGARILARRVLPGLENRSLCDGVYGAGACVSQMWGCFPPKSRQSGLLLYRASGVSPCSTGTLESKAEIEERNEIE